MRQAFTFALLVVTLSCAGDDNDPNSLSYLSVEAVLGRWAAMLGCSTNPATTASNTDYTVLLWPCPRGTPTIELYRTSRGNHQWFRPDNSGLSAVDTIWEFFRDHPRGLVGRFESNSRLIASAGEGLVVEAFDVQTGSSGHAAAVGRSDRVVKEESQIPSRKSETLCLVRDTSSNSAEVPSPSGDWALIPTQIDAG